MGRTNNTWIVNVYVDTEHTTLFRILEFDTLLEIATCLNTKLYEVSNFYHKIKKPTGVFLYLYVYKSIK
jgi:hypothetical protein